MDFMSHFSRDPSVCGGEPVIKGTRVPLKTVLASLAEGASFEEILRDFPTITAKDLQAVVAFAATSAQDDIPLSPLPKVA